MRLFNRTHQNNGETVIEPSLRSRVSEKVRVVKNSLSQPETRIMVKTTLEIAAVGLAGYLALRFVKYLADYQEGGAEHDGSSHEQGEWNSGKRAFFDDAREE